jgi:hypothetical protein
LARELGVQNVDDLCQRLVGVTMIFTRGAVMSAGDDLSQLRLVNGGLEFDPLSTDWN